MNNILEIFEKLEISNGRLLKIEVLEENFNNELLKQTLLAALDPYVNYGIAKFKMPIANFEFQPDLNDLMNEFIVDLLPRLANRELTGNIAKKEVVNLFSKMNVQQQKWCKRILLKKLRAGIQASTVNKIWPNFIKVFKVHLAESLETNHNENKINIIDKVTYPVRVEPKFDGLRCIAIKQNGNTTIYTRNGNVIDTLPTVQKALNLANFQNFVLDGEIMASDWNESSSVVGSTKNKKSDHNMVFNIFDIISLNDWNSQICDVKFSERLKIIKEVVDVCSGPIKAVEGELILNENELITFYEKCLNNGFEGVMIKDLNSRYVFKRSKGMLKMKPVTTWEGTIVGHYKGRDGTKWAGRFGGFNVLLSNGVCTNVGGGFNDVERAVIETETPDASIGKIIEIEGQPPLTKDGRIRFPVYKRYRDEGDVDPKIVETYKSWIESNN